jgi:HSP20 family protein
MQMAKEEQAVVPTAVKQSSPAPRLRHPRLGYYERLQRSFHDDMVNAFEQTLADWMPPLHRRLRHALASRRESPFLFAQPAVDMTEDEKAYTITAEMPGLEQKDIEVSLSGKTLTLTGQKREETEQKEEGVHISERAYGSFQRSFTLPDGVDSDKVSAELSKGVLTITLPKTPEAQKSQKKIEVKAAV